MALVFIRDTVKGGFATIVGEGRREASLDEHAAVDTQVTDLNDVTPLARGRKFRR